MHVFVDETRRGSYALCAVLVQPGVLATSRKLLRGLLTGGERRIHFTKERDSRRREILAELCATPLRARLYESKARPLTLARHHCLTLLLHDLTDDMVRRLVLESVEEEQDRRDRHTIVESRYRLPGLREMNYDHMRPHEEPLLWVADAIA